MGQNYEYIVIDREFPNNTPTLLSGQFVLDNHEPDDEWVKRQVQAKEPGTESNPPIYSQYDERVVIGYNRFENRKSVNPEFRINEEHTFKNTVNDMYVCWGYEASAMVESGHENQGTVNISQTKVPYGTNVTFSATANTPYHFRRWSIPHKQAEFNIDITENKKLTAYFGSQISTDLFVSDESTRGNNMIKLPRGKYEVTVIGAAGGNSGVCGSDNEVAVATGGGGGCISGIFSSQNEEVYNVFVGSHGTDAMKGLSNWYKPISAEDGEDSYISNNDPLFKTVISAQGGSGACYGWNDELDINSNGKGGHSFLTIGMDTSITEDGHDGNFLSGYQNGSGTTVNGSGYIHNEIPHGASKSILLSFPACNTYTTKEDFHGNGTEDNNGYVRIERLSEISFIIEGETIQEQYQRRNAVIVEPQKPIIERAVFDGWTLNGEIVDDLTTIPLRNQDGTSKDIKLSAVFSEPTFILKGKDGKEYGFKATDNKINGELAYTNENGFVLEPYNEIPGLSVINDVYEIIDLSNSISSIADHSFYYCRAINSVDCPAVEKIDAYAFRSCINLKHVKCPKVKSIGHQAFNSCSQIEDIEINNVKTIGQLTFRGCQNLSSLNIPLVSSIGIKAFENCNRLSTIILSSVTEVTKVELESFNNCPMPVSVYLKDDETIQKFREDEKWSYLESINQVAFKVATKTKPLCFTAVDAGAVVQLKCYGENLKSQIFQTSIDGQTWTDHSFDSTGMLTNENSSSEFILTKLGG